MFFKLKAKSTSEVSLKIVSVIYTIIALILLLLPFFWLMSSALKDNIQVYKMPPSFVPALPVRQEIDLDYTGFTNNETLEDVIKKDAIQIIWGTSYEFKDENIHKVKVNVYKDGRMICAFSAQNYTIKSGSRKVLKTISYSPEMVAENYDRLLEWADYKKMEVNGMENTLNDIDTIRIKEYLLTNYSIKGNITGTTKYPDPLQYLNNFIAAWNDSGEIGTYTNKLGFGGFILNSVFVTFFTILAQLIISSLAGYSLSKMIFGKFGKVMLMFFLATMMIPFIATLLPMYIIFKQFSLLDSLWGLVLPATSWAFAIYLFKGFFDKLPKDLIEAARIDGSKEINTYFNIAVPLSKPVFGVIALWTFLGVWNDFMWPNIIIQKPNLWTYTVALYKVQNQGSGNFFPNESMALNLIAVIPTLIVMLIFQKSIQKGIAFSGIKG